ncbi:helix-turn-helix transcriptional regulator [Companilactobacillus mishanensis]|uniref:helix-turn-helix transcriptional regulator n=1 Tax=Companilactobacillus mishanensis TaxID=2486008 RepID=UPI001297B99B|nr:helix-turn-helix domain-containing protein [Companilactobacillus mishanensis]MQS90295.1 helix-turn-helix domain-containing protein [Companilactobacillus mishanensis]
MRNLIREKRKEHKLSQEELANTVGVTRQTINAIEKKSNKAVELHCCIFILEV